MAGLKNFFLKKKNRLILLNSNIFCINTIILQCLNILGYFRKALIIIIKHG